MKHILFILSAVTAIASCTQEHQHSLRMATYNVGVFNKADTNTITMVADMMQEIDVEILSLNELDSCTVRTDKEYQLDSLAKALGNWNFIYSPSIRFQGGKYGIGIAAKPEHEILEFNRILLPKEESKEQRVLAVAEFEDFVFASTHLDHSSPKDQLKQAQTASRWLIENYGDCNKAVFLCGDMNASPESETMEYFKRDWTILSSQDNTYPAIEPQKCIDYIMVLNGSAECVVRETAVLKKFKTGDVEIASDHLPVLVDVEW